MLDRRILKLQNVITTCDGYERVLDEVHRDKNDDDDITEKKLTDYDKFDVRRKSFYLLNLYQIVFESQVGTRKRGGGQQRM